MDISRHEYKDQLARLPARPGVYRFHDAAGRCLYVGKARDLSRRVASYFTGRRLDPRLSLMLDQVRSLEITTVSGEAEALLLENNLIKELRPRYNVKLRDDKSYPYLRIGDGEFPRLSFFRGRPDRRGHFFGPYTSARQLRQAMSTVRRVFRLRTCEDSVLRQRSRPCLLGQMDRCSRPCVGHISAADYQSDADAARRFLGGRGEELLASLRSEMLAASDALEFERAAALRDRLTDLRSALRPQDVASTGAAADADIIAVASAGDRSCVNLALVRGGQHLGDHAVFPEEDGPTDPGELLEAFVSHHYAYHPAPALVICADADPDSLATTLTALAGRQVTVSAAPRGVRRRWLEMARQGAELALRLNRDRHALTRSRLADLRARLDLPAADGAESGPRIECWDVSHSSGEATQASRVVFERLAMRPAEYRRYRVSGIAPGDDCAALRQVLTRRYSALARDGEEEPDLVLIDGGPPQTRAAREVFAELGLDPGPIVGIAKDEGRRTGLETLVFADGRPSLTLGPDSPALMLLAMIRDEAHRFAITGMRRQRSRDRLRGGLEDIPGVGPRRRQALIAHFGGLPGLRRATVDDIAKIRGVSAALARSVYAFLHGGQDDPAS